MRLIICLAIAAVSLSAVTAFAQNKATQEIDYIYPAGGVPGTTINAFIGGQKLAAINDFTVYLDDLAIGGLDSKEELKLKAELNKLEASQKQFGKPGPAELARMNVLKQKLAQFDRQGTTKKNIADIIIKYIEQNHAEIRSHRKFEG